MVRPQGDKRLVRPNRVQKFLRLAAGAVGIVDVGIQLDRHPALVAAGGDLPQDGGEVDRPSAGNQMLVLARGGDVFEVIVLGVRGHAGDPLLAAPRPRNRRGRCRSSSPPRANRSARQTPGIARNVSISRPGSGSINRSTSSRSASSTQGIDLVVEERGGRLPRLARRRSGPPGSVWIDGGAQFLGQRAAPAWYVRGEWPGSAGRARSTRDANRAAADRPRRSS